MCGKSWTTAQKCEYCTKCCHDPSGMIVLPSTRNDHLIHLLLVTSKWWKTEILFMYIFRTPSVIKHTHITCMKILRCQSKFPGFKFICFNPRGTSKVVETPSMHSDCSLILDTFPQNNSYIEICRKNTSLFLTYPTTLQVTKMTKKQQKNMAIILNATLNLNFLFKVHWTMCGYSWTTAPKCEYCPECCHEMDNIECEQPNCHFTINEGDAGDAAPSR
jgi:hypothetical protein